MKQLRDLIIPRKDLQDWDDNITWVKDGSIYITTVPELTKANPVYTSEVNYHSKNLFHLKELPLELANKFEFEQASRNALLNSIPNSNVRLCRVAKMDLNYVAILTNNCNVTVFDPAGNAVVNLDEPDRSVESRAYHSVDWSPQDEYIAVGNEMNEIVIFEMKQEDQTVKFNHFKTIQLDAGIENAWVTNIKWYENGRILAVLSNNAVYCINERNWEASLISSPGRYKIIDIQIVGENYVVISMVGVILRVDLRTMNTFHLETGLKSESKIIPIINTENIILLSNNSSCKIDIGASTPTISNDDVISPYLEKKFKKWNDVWNEFNKHETTLSIYGISLSPDKFSVAILYNIERVSIKYLITSERQYNITFIPLSDNWKISRFAKGFAWYQTYSIYNNKLPIIENAVDTSSTKFDTNTDFNSYLKTILNDEKMNYMRFFNFTREHPKIDVFRKTIYEYAIANKDLFTNDLDIACFESLASILHLDCPIHLSNSIPIKSDFIQESFNFGSNSDNPDVITAEGGNNWRRCSVTLLPILTTEVKICPMSKQRVISLEQSENLNEFGWFTRTLLQVFNDVSVYCGTDMQ
ncbi:hypothetical protein KAFR_0B01720 [Kazachstania africana CBS 2517]|uniref:Transcription factor IIIC putative zinc-finger domain-containing protein n=1 Tax=Kazachstania africana (strain ATCC 22294 / BCRC 22015 / CBS 2517 / CECT 1963 / NBRC 1671 / NRRL Y-8276) TaxID=1071382 RepID=H2AQ21_KAZAF|nr:hypothetical protein KAFR_0B01720 [Kazachstania africana CBS 2517]CCF56471.1 hypothetical protein KAFR_0B01720 [Kazachstania africana CBS 2517]